jgi:hypothetical protein
MNAPILSIMVHHDWRSSTRPISNAKSPDADFQFDIKAHPIGSTCERLAVE